MTQESYGPIVAVRRVRDDAEALAVANALPFGLSAYVYSRDLERAWSFAERLQSGAVGINVNDTTELQRRSAAGRCRGSAANLGRKA